MLPHVGCCWLKFENGQIFPCNICRCYMIFRQANSWGPPEARADKMRGEYSSRLASVWPGFVQQCCAQFYSQNPCNRTFQYNNDLISSKYLNKKLLKVPSGQIKSNTEEPGRF